MTQPDGMLTPRIPVDYYAGKDEKPDPVNSEWSKFNDCVRLAKAYKQLQQEISDSLDISRQTINGLTLELAAEREVREREKAVWSDRCLKDPVVRLNNICAALEEQRNESPFSKEAWDALTEENNELHKRAESAEAKLAMGTDRLPDAIPFLCEQGMVVWQNDYDILRNRASALEADAGRLREEIEALTQEGRQGELEQANVGLAAENERLREGLRWYAEGHHYDLPDWEDCLGESSNWLFPPTDHGWMVENGGIAKAVLEDGHSINPKHAEDDYITIAPDSALRDGV